LAPTQWSGGGFSARRILKLRVGTDLRGAVIAERSAEVDSHEQVCFLYLRHGVTAEAGIGRYLELEHMAIKRPRQLKFDRTVIYQCHGSSGAPMISLRAENLRHD